MDGIILVNKEKGITSRDVVNRICDKLNTNKVGHTGTLDPIATGLMIVCVNEGLKLVELLTGLDKDYIATVRLGIKTDTFDTTGRLLEKNDNYKLTREELEKTLDSFNKEYWQTVPIYSSVKVNGKKLYEYARIGKTVELPKHLVKVSNISDELKNKTIKELEILAESYVNDINSFNNKNELNPFDSEYQIRMTYIKALVDIEQKISDPKEIKNYSLKRQLLTFKKELNQND